MKLEKLFYVILSTVLITVFILVSYISSPSIFQERTNSSVKKLYFADHISSAHQKVIDKFNNKYKGQIEVVPINLSFEKFSTNERKELLARYLRSKSDRIDIFSVDQIWVPRFAMWGIPLEKYITKQQRENLLSYAMESCYYKNELVAVPLYIDIALMYYRQDILKKLPDFAEVKKKIDASITWEDFLKLSERLAKQNNPYFVFQADDFEGLICIFVELLAGKNQTLVSGQGVHINTPEAREVLQFLVDLVNKYKISPAEVVKFRENISYNYFIANNGVFLRGWPSFLNDYKTRIKYKEIYSNLQKAPTPHFSGTKPVSVYGGWNLIISKYSSKIPEAIVFMNFLISEEAQKILFEEGGYLPVNNKLYTDSSFIAQHPDLLFYERLLRSGIHRPFVENYTNISDIISYYINQAIQKKITASEALVKAEENINSGRILLK